MNYRKSLKRMQSVAVAASTVLLLAAVPATAQDYPPPAAFAPQQLDSLVSRIALYPDPLLAQVLAASTFPDQIPDAARWADDNRGLRGDDLANRMAEDNLPFDPSVQALIPFPDVLDMMARDMDWTSQLGNAVLAQRPDVMDAVQRMRAQAEAYGYLRSNPQVVVSGGPGYVEIVPCNPDVLYVPVYDPYVVFAPPRPGFWVGGAIRFSPGYSIGFSFVNWGWGGGFNWRSHTVIVNNVVWERNWYNRRAYAPDWGRWAGGRWNGGYVDRHVTVNNRVVNNRVVVDNRPDYRREAVRPEPVHRDQNAFRPPDSHRAEPFVRNEQVNRGYSAPESRNFSRGGEPARVQAPNRAPERAQSFRGDSGRAERNAAPASRESHGDKERGSRR